MPEGESIQVEVAYALPDKQIILPVTLPAGGTAIEAARQSGVCEQFEGIDLDNSRLGIFGMVVSPGKVLKAGDRVEIYRPLLADPKEIRKERATRARERRSKDKPS